MAQLSTSRTSGKKLREENKRELQDHAESHGSRTFELLRFGQLPEDCCYQNLDWYFEMPDGVRLKPVKELKSEKDSAEVRIDNSEEQFDDGIPDDV